jgi:hypothetical protein
VANGIFVSARNGFQGSHATRVDLDADTIKAGIFDHGTDTPVLATDDFYNDINTALVGALSSALASKTIGTVAAGVFDADNVTFTAVSGNSAESIVVLKDTGTASTSDLLGFWDTATGLPVTPNGGDITITWSASGLWTF